MPAYTSSQYAQRDRLALDYAAVHRVILPRCAAQVLSGGKPITHALNRMTDDGDLCRYERCLPGGLTAYTLSPRAAARLGLSSDRADLPAGSVLDTAIAVQVFCCLGPHLRYRLNSEESASLFEGAVAPNVPLVLSNELGGTKAFRGVLAANRPPGEVVRYVRTLISQAEQHPKLSQWAVSRQLGFAVLTPNMPSREMVEKALTKSQLSRHASIIVGLGPDADHLAASLKQLDQK